MKRSREIMGGALSALLIVGCFDFDRSFDPCFGGGEDCGGDGASSGGSSATGGGSGDGGTSSSGGAGSGGDASGGDTSGGGSSTGGSGGTGTGGTPGEGPRPRVNEIFAGTENSFIEIYNAGTGNWNYLGYSVATGQLAPDFSRDCILLEGTLPPGEFLVVTPGSSLCEPGSPPFVVQGGTPASTVYVFDPEGELIDERSYPDSTAPLTPALGESWQVLPDGGVNWRPALPTRGTPNQ